MGTKNTHFDELQRIKKRVNFAPLTTKQSDYYAKWYYPVLRELAVRADWKGDYDVLASLINPTITAKEAKEAVELMVEIKVLIKNGDDYAFESENIEDSAVPIYAKKKARRDTFLTGLDSLERFGPHERYSSYATFAANDEAYEEINKLYEEFLDKITDKVTDVECDKVFQLNYQLFPVSKKIEVKREDKEII